MTRSKLFLSIAALVGSFAFSSVASAHPPAHEQAQRGHAPHVHEAPRAQPVVVVPARRAPPRVAPARVVVTRPAPVRVVVAPRAPTVRQRAVPVRHTRARRGAPTRRGGR